MPAREALEDSSTRSKPFTAAGVARDFGSDSRVAQDGVQALYAAIRGADNATARWDFAKWKTQSAAVCGYDLDCPSNKLTKLATHYGIHEKGDSEPEIKQAELLFAVHTYYVIVVKLLTTEIVSASHQLTTPRHALAQGGTSAKLQSAVRELEAGAIFRQLHIANFLEGDLFAWYTSVWSAGIEQFIRQLLACLQSYDPARLSADPADSRDLLKTLYQQLFPKSVRHALGEYYTPDWLAEHVLNELEYVGNPDQRILDPACGSGTFLVLAIGRIRRWYAENRAKCPLTEQDLCRKILANVVGFDLNPLAVMAARANYLIALRDLIGHVERVEIPVYLCDSILTRAGDPEPEKIGAAEEPRLRVGFVSAATEDDLARVIEGRFDFVVGNPPWVAWDHLPADYRDATKPLWEHYGLFSLSGSAARHGGGKKDLSMLMLYASMDRYLKEGGTLAFVITQTLFQTKGAGDGFRRFQIGESGAHLAVLQVNDMVRFQPFAGAANWTSTVVIRKGTRTTWPVRYRQWRLVAGLPGDASCDWQAHFTREEYLARPIDRLRENSPWIVQPRQLQSDLQRALGPSAYQAHLGANSGGANGVYWVNILEQRGCEVVVQNLAERSKTALESVTCAIEPELLYPLIRWQDVKRYASAPSAYLILAQDTATRTGIPEATMRGRLPKTHSYLRQFQPFLERRAAYRRYQGSAPFYSMYDVDSYTLAPVKVVWRRMDSRINAAVVTAVDDPILGMRPVVPQETCVLIDCADLAEAHYICGYVNSLVINYVVRSHSVRGGKGFGTPSMLDYIALQQFRQSDPAHQRLAQLSRQAHARAALGQELDDVQAQIDAAAAALFGLGAADSEVLRTQRQD